MGLHKRMEEKGMNTLRNDETVKAVKEALMDEELTMDEQFATVVMGLMIDISKSLADIADTLKEGRYDE